MNLLDHDMQFYGAVYLGAGITTLLVVLAANWHSLRPDPQSLESLIEAAIPQPKTLWYRIRAKVLAPLLGGMLMVLLWPVVPVMKLKQWWDERQAEIQRKEDVFKVQRQHLLERLTVAQIEAREMVEDPLQAVLSLPFGHLNAVWCDLVAGLSPGDECWSFEAKWLGRFGSPELRKGYVLWRRGKAVSHVLTVCKELEPVWPELPVRLATDKGARRADLSSDEVEIPAFLRKQAD
jgi:hypothetical protein